MCIPVFHPGWATPNPYDVHAMSMRLFLMFAEGPPVLWRKARWCVVLSVVCAVIGGAVAVWRYGFAPRREAWPRYAIMVFGFMPPCVIYPAGYLALRSVRREWHRTGGKLCKHCAYDVSGLDPRGTCPECGKLYDLEADAKYWHDAGLYAKASAGNGRTQERTTSTG